MFSRLAYWEDGNVTVTLLPEADTLEICRPSMLTLGSVFIRLKV